MCSNGLEILRVETSAECLEEEVDLWPHNDTETCYRFGEIWSSCFSVSVRGLADMENVDGDVDQRQEYEDGTRDAICGIKFVD